MEEREYVNVNDVRGDPSPRTVVKQIQVKDAWDGATAWAVVFAVASLGFALFGIVTLYGDSHIVGGDAYNYLISSTRGVGLIGIGILLAVIACGLLLLSANDRARGTHMENVPRTLDSD